MEQKGIIQMISKEYVRRYCSEFEKIENYDLAVTDMENTWDCHHRLEIGPNGERISVNDLKKHGLYYHRPHSELIFLTHAEHRRLHKKGETHSEATKMKISAAMKGKSPSNKGKPSPNKGKHHSEETKQKISEAKKRYWEQKKKVGK